MTRRIGILLTSNDTSDFAARHPHDGEKFARLLQPLRPDWEFRTVSVKDGAFPERAEDFDGYVITGSPASVHDGLPWIDRLLALIRSLHALQLPTVGVCFGHQAIALALGGAVEDSAGGWGLNIAEARYATFPWWMQPEHRTIRMYTAHKEQVTRLPAGAEVLSGDAHCPIGSYRIADHFFTTQHHPEMTRDFMTGLVTEMRPFVPATLADKAALEFATAPAEGAKFAGWMAHFLDPRTP